MLRVVDAGMSRQGWSRIGTFIKCPYVVSAKKQGHVQSNRDALDKGTLGHTAQAHLHLIEGTKLHPVQVNGEWVDDASAFADPLGAMRIQAAHNPGMREHLPLMEKVFNGYLEHREHGVGDAYMVEQEVLGILGTCKGVFGLHLVADDQWDLIAPGDGREAPATVKHYDGTIITPHPLNVPGHPSHGWPIYISRRMDLVRSTGSRRHPRKLVEDHKHKGRINQGKSVKGYRAEDGFVAMEIMAQQRFGAEYDGLMLNLICTAPATPGEQRRVRLPPSAAKAKAWPMTMWYFEQQLAQLEVWSATGVVPLQSWPRRGLEVGGNCVSVYGACDLYDHCHNGTRLNIPANGLVTF